MNLSSRQSDIIALIRREGFQSIEALANHFAVTPQTIRRDVNSLCDANVLRRRHGGAELLGATLNAPYESRRVTNLEAKRRIGAAVAGLIPSRASVLFGIGTTPEQVALAMAGEHDDGWSWIERALPLLERRAGPNHRDVADLSLALASISLREHEYDDALLWYGRAIEILETNFGADDPRIVHPLAGLGLAELALGRMDGAWVAFTRMHEVETRHGSLAGNREKALAGMNEAALALGIPVTLTSR